MAKKSKSILHFVAKKSKSILHIVIKNRKSILHFRKKVVPLRLEINFLN